MGIDEDGVPDGFDVVGVILGVVEGFEDGLKDGLCVGNEIVGLNDGDSDGDNDGTDVLGDFEGKAEEGWLVGEVVGIKDNGANVGTDSVGITLGIADGPVVGAEDGKCVGDDIVGIKDGKCDGYDMLGLREGMFVVG